jgi:hypothetical protein
VGAVAAPETAPPAFHQPTMAARPCHLIPEDPVMTVVTDDRSTFQGENASGAADLRQPP